MAKTIKFNLICDGKPVRTIEDLQNHFCIEDVLDYYNNQLLHRWLSVRGYHKELSDVSAITSTDSLEIIRELIRIFDIASDKDKVEECIYGLRYQQERKERNTIYEQQNSNVQQIVADYYAGYHQLVDEILENPNDAALIKANIAEIVTNYKYAFCLDYKRLLYDFRENAPLAVMCFLMNEVSRSFYIIDEVCNADCSTTIVINDFYDEGIYRDICSLTVRSDFQRKLGDCLKTFSGVTDGYWKDLEPKERKYMIISMEEGDYVRSSGRIGGDLSCKDIKNKFVIVDGIDYKSNSSNHKLRYMEV